ncbi:uncharacterized protein Bfra_011470 [Botrytis fragariae]|uniref:RRM domain-containing protein n=1 Tax=Botrytis fragariae TaxID=1964551 RepID=A0A8H6AY83_9HELO|nr:uncharacterized protein Bfra_011470 [Botrytis fragariae]KAF5875707.1 hypothetical protein Bfra_011470 [Botrytis fragariae]
MDITLSKSWYNGRTLPSENSIKNRKVQGKLNVGTRSSTSSKASDTTITARENPAPSRVSANHVQRLEGLAIQAEHDQDEENEFETNSQTLGQRFARTMTLDESIKNSPPKRSRWHEMFESRHRMTAPHNSATNANRNKSPLSLFGNALPKRSPANGASSQMMGSKNASGPTPTPGKTSHSNDSKLFRAFLNRGDGAVPFFISPAGTHQQFFPVSARSSQNTSVVVPSNTPCEGICAAGFFYAAEPTQPAQVAQAVQVVQPAQTVRLAQPAPQHLRTVRSMNSSRSINSRSTAHTRTDTSLSTTSGADIWTPADRSFDTSASQYTGHTRMTSASGSFVDKSQHTRMASASTGFGNFSYQPAIFENEQMTTGPIADSPPEFNDFNQVAPEILPVSMEYFTQSMAVAPTTVFAPQPPTMGMDSMMTAQVAIPDLSHLVKKFRPTNMLLREQGMIPDTSRQDTNYEGDENHPDLLDLPEHINCCMWIINIPEEIGYAEFMQILDCGAVAALSMVRPQNGHTTQAAKATFKTNAGGAELYRRARNKGGLRIRGRKIKVWYNDYGAYEWKGPETRFLEIEAPQLLDEAFWHGYFGSWCKYIIISVTPMPCRKYGFACTRFEFVRIAGQAQTCYQAIQKDMTFLGQVNVRYGIDPNEI